MLVGSGAEGKSQDAVGVEETGPGERGGGARRAEGGEHDASRSRAQAGMGN